MNVAPYRKFVVALAAVGLLALVDALGVEWGLVEEAVGLLAAGGVYAARNDVGV